MLSFLLFTIGYLPINYEARYLWYMVPLSMVVGGLYMQRMDYKGLKKAMPYVFALSFLLYPVWSITDMYNLGRDDYTAAIELKQMNVKGSFTVYPSRGRVSWPQRMAYFSGMQYYSIPKPDSSSLNNVLNEMNRYHVNYLIWAGDYSQQKLPDGKRTLTDVSNGKINGMSVFLINP